MTGDPPTAKQAKSKVPKVGSCALGAAVQTHRAAPSAANAEPLWNWKGSDANDLRWTCRPGLARKGRNRSMDHWLKLVRSAACRKRHEIELGLRLRQWLLHGGEAGARLRRWLLPSGHAHDPDIREVTPGDMEYEAVAQRRRSMSRTPETAPHTPMYRGRPARLWWLPEQEMPKAEASAGRLAIGESFVCAKCGETNPSHSAFCGGCGLYLRPRWVQPLRWRNG